MKRKSPLIAALIVAAATPAFAGDLLPPPAAPTPAVQSAPPAAVSQAVQDELDRVKSEYDALNTRVTELEGLRDTDRQAYEQRLTELESKIAQNKIDDLDARAHALEMRRGLADQISDVSERMVNDGGRTDEEIEAGVEADADLATGGATDQTVDQAGPTEDAPVDFEPIDDTTADDTGAVEGGANDASGVPGAQPAAQQTWWQSLLSNILNSLVDAASNGLARLFRWGLTKIRDKADDFITAQGSANPNWKSWIATVVRNGVDQILSGGSPAPVTTQPAPAPATPAPAAAPNAPSTLAPAPTGAVG